MLLIIAHRRVAAHNKGDSMKLNDKHKQALEKLSEDRVHFDRLSDDTWIFWTSGYNHMDHSDIDLMLRQSGFKVDFPKFDRICGKTFSKFTPRIVS